MRNYVLLFRGINVGGRHILPMKSLVSLLTEQGYQSVQTYIQSGNVVLQSAARPDNRIADQIEQHFGFLPDVMILERTEFESMAANNPYTVSDGKQVHLFVANDNLKPDLAKLEALADKTEEFTIWDRVCYLFAPNGIGRSKLAVKIDRCLGVPVTGRNLNTVNKLLSMLSLTEES